MKAMSSMGADNVLPTFRGSNRQSGGKRASACLVRLQAPGASQTRDTRSRKTQVTLRGRKKTKRKDEERTVALSSSARVSLWLEPGAWSLLLHVQLRRSDASAL